jgi:hypothetical protein
MHGLSVAHATKGNKDRSHVGIPAGSLSSWQQTLDQSRTLPETFPADEQYCTTTWSPKFHGGSITAQIWAIIGD